jgi:hypothetical protein
VVDVTVYPADGTDTIHLHGEAVSFVNQESYGQARNFGIGNSDTSALSNEVILVNLSNIVAVKVEVR